MARNSLKNVCRLINAVQNELPVEQSFLADLKRSIELTDANNTRVSSKAYKPSSMKCLRGMYYMVTGAEPDKGENTYCSIGICNSGTDTHIRIQTAIDEMKKNGIDCEYVNVADYVREHKLDYLEIRSQDGMETKLFHKDLNISFMCDGIIKYKNHYYILELKTESLHKWSTRKDVNPEHHNQAIAYSLSLDLPEVLFVYICRDNLDMKAYMFNVTDEMRHELVAKITTCDDYVKKFKTPPIPYDFDRKICRWCSYTKVCKLDNSEETENGGE